ncbi:NAD(P)H-binding protein [Micromonospora sp. NPDC050397]|uniref:NAD(P)H-binding protein n=1 Tax=Micromonospora sp. NPDC050397 TaxID=3364279 RepID=UPI00384A70B5
MTILITGSTGMVSGEVLRQVAGKAPVRALVRDKSRAPELDGVEYVVGDLNDASTLAPAFDGVSTLWLLTPMGPLAPSQSMHAVRAAQEAGVGHIVRLSAIGAAHDAPTRNGRLHALSDVELQHSGIPWTIVRPSHFMQNLLGTVAGEHLFGLLGESRVGAVDVADIGAVGTEILLAPQRHEGKIYTLTGPESFSLDQAAEEITRTAGRSVRYLPQSPEQTLDNLLQAGLDAWTAEVLTEYRVAYGSGWGDFTNDHVASVVGRPARSFAEFVRDHREQFANA